MSEMRISIPKILNYLRHPSFRKVPRIQKGAWKLLRLISTLGSLRHREAFDGVRYFCLFVGHPHSGHSLVGSLLDAHPNVVIAHELHALKCVKQGVTAKELYYLLLSQSRWFARQNAEWAQYDYDVPRQYKGTYSSLQVIGDKKGGGTSGILHEHPDLLSQLKQQLEVPVKVLHVTRHPLDNISTSARKHHDGDVDSAIERYFRLFESVRRAQTETAAENWLTMAHEALISDTQEALQRLCTFLEVDASKEYLSDCEKVVFDEPNRSRKKVTYRAEQVDRIRRMSSDFSSLSRYEYS